MTSRRKIFSLFSLRSPWSSSSPHLSLAVVLKKKIAPQLCSLSIPGCAGSRTISDVVLFLCLVLCSELCELWRERKYLKIGSPHFEQRRATAESSHSLPVQGQPRLKHITFSPPAFNSKLCDLITFHHTLPTRCRTTQRLDSATTRSRLP
jgi:hypothetical protein